MFEGAAREAFVHGARLFDAGAFFEAHEVWEARWRAETNPSARRLLQGFIQVAAAFHKLFVMKNPASAARLLARGRAKIETDENEPGSRALFCAGVRRWERALAELVEGEAPDRRTPLPRVGSL
jgi:hypothetical protein